MKFLLYGLGVFKLLTAIIPDLGLGLYGEAVFDGMVGIILIVSAKFWPVAKGTE